MRSTSQLGSLVASALVAVLVVGSALDTVEAQRRRGRDVQRQATSSAQESTLVFEGLPDGAEVFVDERPVGVGPLGPVTVDPGEHVVRVRLQGYTEHTEVIEVPRGAQRRLAVDLIALAHVVAVTTTPAGARPSETPAPRTTPAPRPQPTTQRTPPAGQTAAPAPAAETPAPAPETAPPAAPPVVEPPRQRAGPDQ
jgi:hypothetical protein